MKYKSIAKTNRACGGSLRSETSPCAPNVELITENVFVPIAKTIFTKTRTPVHRNVSKRKIKPVNLNWCNRSGVTMSLLKRPPCLPINKLREDKKGETWKKSIDESYTTNFTDNQSKDHSERADNKKNKVLLFPSSISDLPFTLLAKCKPLLVDKSPTKSTNRCKRSGKVDERTMRNGIDRILFNLAKTSSGDNGDSGGSCEKFKLNKVKRGVLRSQNNSPKISHSSAVSTDGAEKIRLLDGKISSEPVLLNDVSSTPIASSGIATATKPNDGSRCSFLPHCNSALKEISEGTATYGISDVNHVEEVNIPVKRIESKIAIGRIVGRCITTFDPSTSRTSNSFLDTNRPEVCRKLLPMCNSQGYPWKEISSFDGKNNPSTVCEKDGTRLQKIERYHPCRIKYSWQVVGTSSQTSQTLLANLAKKKEKEKEEEEGSALDDDESMVRSCSVKYSWQIIGITTQTCAKDFTVEECRSAVSFLSARTENRGGDDRNNSNAKDTSGESAARIGTFWRNGKRFIVLNNQCTQTFAHKENQTVFTELYELRNIAADRMEKGTMGGN
ncbi:hypothetical protein ANTRET_LOCUS10925 [Anthophora retusa]